MNPTCLTCQATDAWATVEEILGTAAFVVDFDNILQFQGHTEIDWNTSESIAVMCMECDTDYDFKSFPRVLVRIKLQRQHASEIKCCCDNDSHWERGQHIGANDNHQYHRSKDH